MRICSLRQVAAALLLVLSAALASPAAQGADPWVVYRGAAGPGLGRNVVLISGDEEYRSEEALPQLAQILAKHHGFTCTVLFAIGPDGVIDPTVTTNIPGLEALRTADLMVIATRFRNLPDAQMREIDDYVQSGRPIIGLRTATHAFNIPADRAYARYSWQSKAKGWDGGFGRQVLGETWVAHHGDHGRQSTRGRVAPESSGHPIVQGIAPGEVWGPTDVYAVRLPLPGDCAPLILGEVVADMTPTGPALAGPKNAPMMPVAWTKTYTGAAGKPARVVATTMGAATDLSSAGVRRLLVNAVYWAIGQEAAIRPDLPVDLVGTYQPTAFGFGKFVPGTRPESLQP